MSSRAVVLLIAHLHPNLTQGFTRASWDLSLPLPQCFTPVHLYPSPPWTLLGLKSEYFVPSFRLKEGGHLNSFCLTVEDAITDLHPKLLRIHSQNQRLLTADPWKSPLEGFFWPWEHPAPMHRETINTRQLIPLKAPWTSGKLVDNYPSSLAPQSG